jgi:hypothetical protein
MDSQAGHPVSRIAEGVRLPDGMSHGSPMPPFFLMNPGDDTGTDFLRIGIGGVP